eukprot:CAMPEP_0172426156 /NCGR_PEP_ID=MMETSP1064-20121228/36083_1 /TAXON_ID=202472 /ORGANISM="Aulacoseira subarctica , Strain CCAP 1002/5" /LENGTH=309 /DNA_ID=CAMNT_0013169577 /DNA_START=35 /DNA_END=964 /DNA_ORIENTATION=-
MMMMIRLNASSPFLAALVLLLVQGLNLTTCESYSNEPVSTVTSKTYTLFHDLDGSGTFVPRSVIHIISSTTTTTGDGTSNAKEGIHVEIKHNAEQCWNVSSSSLDPLLLKLKMVDDQGHEARSAVSSCSMRRSFNHAKQQFREKLEVMVSPTGDLLSFSLMPIISPLAPPCSNKELLSSSQQELLCFSFHTQVSVEGATMAASVPLVLPASRPPPGLLFFPSAKIGGDPNQPEGQQQQSKSFFIRYWYIILPVLIITLMGGGEEPPPPAGPKSSAGGATSTTASSTTSSVAKSEASDTSGVPKRRGKRD